MQKSRLGFNVFLAVTTLIAALVVARVSGVPFRDPDSATGPAYLRLPVILIVVLIADVIPRAIRRATAFRDVPGTVVEVVRERWSRANMQFTLIGLLAWYTTYASVRNLKGFVPFVNQRLYDASLERIDRALFFGHDPAVLLHQLMGTGVAAHVLSFFYIAWIVLLPLSLGVALVWHRETSMGSWWVTAVAADWVFGVATNYALPTLGPIYVDPGDFSSLAHTTTTNLQNTMWIERVNVMAHPDAVHIVQNIAAFASLHVAIAATACVVAQRAGAHRLIRWSLNAFLVITMVATVYFGWHYVSDVIAGLVVGVAGAWIGAITTGHGRIGSLPPGRREPATVVQVD